MSSLTEVKLQGVSNTSTTSLANDYIVLRLYRHVLVSVQFSHSKLFIKSYSFAETCSMKVESLFF